VACDLNIKIVDVFVVITFNICILFIALGFWVGCAQTGFDKKLNKFIQ
jgi:hypothetical protein